MLTQDVGVQTDAYQNGERPLGELLSLSHPVDYQTPSTQFMLQMFNILQKGMPLARAAGRNRNTADFEKADTIRSFTAKGITQKIVRKRLELSFKIPGLPKNEHLRLAEFRCKRTALPLKKYRVKVIFFKGPNVARKVLLDTYKLKEHSASEGLGNMATRGKRSIRGTNRGRQQKNRRWKKSGKKQSCRLYDFEVDFTTIGWGQWIIHPTRFNSKFCYGNCPSPIDMRLKPTNHAMLQSLMRSKRSKVAPAPCCVPTKLEPLSMMYVEDGEVVVRHHEDMIASECGCR
ncbi:growth/differentiation factor 6-B-like [Haliotis rubra]|uniref:growth/differentiation factor 6-B-like n=1 Tax=Haliotis rubra TaxID=36100 RepID=UPI001EE55B57|nr:growth/differentiation factor 6-B-like [Haliotis rubra]